MCTCNANNDGYHSTVIRYMNGKLILTAVFVGKNKKLRVYAINEWFIVSVQCSVYASS